MAKARRVKGQVESCGLGTIYKNIPDDEIKFGIFSS